MNRRHLAYAVVLTVAGFLTAAGLLARWIDSVTTYTPQAGS